MIRPLSLRVTTPLHGETPTIEPDAALAARLRAGDADALEDLFRRYSTELLRLASGLMPTHADAEDLVQDVFVGLRLALRGYEERGTFRAWLRGVTVRSALAARRRAGARQETPIDDTLGPAVAHDPNTPIALRDAMARLPQSLRDVFVLKMVEGYSHAEVGRLLGISSSASEVRLFRAVRRLRDLLSEQE